MGRVVFFSANDEVHGYELWVTDGTSQGTRMVKDINPNNDILEVFRGSSPQDIADLGNGRVIFRAEDNIFGGRDELWVSDGTEAGTGIVRNIGGSINSEPGAMTQVSPGLAVFHAKTETHGRELWVTDGTYNGTRMIADINSGSGDAFDSIRFENSVRITENFVSLGFGRVVFSADDGVHGRELWVTDGTEAGTKLLKDIMPGSGSGVEVGADKIMALGNGQAIFSADDGTDGKVLWVTDGTSAGTVLLRDLAIGDSNGSFEPLPNGLVEGRYLPGGYSSESFLTDGTVAGTVIGGESPLTEESIPTPPTWDPENGSHALTSLNSVVQLPDGRALVSGSLLQLNDDGDLLRWASSQLWVSDGSRDGTKLVFDLESGGVPSVYSSFDMLPDGRFLFSEDYGGPLWVTDGTPDGTHVFDEQIQRVLGDPHFFPNGLMIFVGEDQSDALHLYVTNGTSAGTQIIGAGIDSYSLVTDMGNRGWLIADFTAVVEIQPGVYERQYDFWITDATGTGTKKVASGIDLTEIQKITQLDDNSVLFTYRELFGGIGREPWILNLDGGARLIQDALPGQSSSNPRYLTQMTPEGEIPIPVSTLFPVRVNLEEEVNFFDLDDYFTDPEGGTLRYAVTGTPDEITVNSATSVITASEDVAAGNYAITITASTARGSTVTSNLDWSVIDTGKLAIATTGDWGREVAGGPITSTLGAVITIGRKDGTAQLFRIEPLDPTVPGGTTKSVAKIENGKITLEGKLYSEQVSTTKPLMEGKFTVDMAKIEVSNFEDANSNTDYRMVADLIDFTFADINIATDKISFRTDMAFDDGGGTGPSYVALSTKNAPLSISFGANGVDFGASVGTARWSPEPIEFDLGGGSSMSIGFSDLGVDYEAASDSIFVSGKATVSWGGAIENGFNFVGSDSESSLTIDLFGKAQQNNYFQRGDKFLKLSKGSDGWDWDVVGEVKYQDKYEGPVPSKGFLVKELVVGFDTIQDKYSGGFKANIPLLWGLDLSASLGFVATPDLKLDSISIGVDKINYPIGTTGLFVQGGTLAMENLALADRTAGYTYKAAINGTLGPDTSIIKAPLHGSIEGIIKETNANKKIGYILSGKVDLDSKVSYFLPDVVNKLAAPLIEYFGVNPSDVSNFEVLTATSRTDLDLTKNRGEYNANVSLLGGAVKGAAQFINAPNATFKDARDISASLSASLQIPDAFPLVGGMTRSGKAIVKYSSDGDFSNDLAAFWSQITIPLYGVFAFGGELTFDGKFKFLGRKDIPKISSWNLDEDSGTVILTARWEVGDTAAQIEVITPEGLVLTEADIAARDDITLVDDLSTTTSRHVALQNPSAGLWDLRLATPSGLGVITYQANEMLANAVAPIASLTPDAENHQATIVVDLDAGDAETVDIVIFAASSVGQVAGIELARVTVNEGDLPVAQIIDYDALGPGDWHIYTRTEADGLVPMIEMHPTPITITGAADLSTSARQTTHTATGAPVITITITNVGDRPSEPGKLEITVPDGMVGGDPIPDIDANPLENNESELNLPALAPGESLTIKIALPVGAEDLADAIFIDAWTPGFDADLTDNGFAQVLQASQNTPPTGAVVIIGTAEDAQVLTADISGIIEPDTIVPDTLAYQWRRDGVDIPGDTGSSYLLTAQDVGTDITVKVTYVDEGGTEEEFTSAIVVPVEANAPTEGHPLILGETIAEGEVLSVDPSTVTDADGIDESSFVFQWQRNGINIEGATEQSYELTQEDVGAEIRVQMDLSDLKGNQTSTFSLAIIPQFPGLLINGTSGPNDLPGGSGNDTIYGLDGDDSLEGGDGDDDLFGGLGDDLLEGGKGFDYLSGGGGGGGDYAAYYGAAAGVDVDLSVGIALDDGDGGLDLLDGIEHVFGSFYDDRLTGDDNDNVFIGLDGDDDLDGGEGRDLAVFAGDQASYTLTISPTETLITSRASPNENGTDTLKSIEFLDFETNTPLFDGRLMNLDNLDGPAVLTADEFSTIIELYIAYFNRAPDAIGLNYWGTQFANGRTLAKMSEQFFRSSEARETYESVLDEDFKLDITDPAKVDSFVTQVYANVLGRDPDPSGFAYWTNQLETSTKLTPGKFILAIIKGAKFPGNPTDQTAEDQAYLATKADLGTYFAVIKGMSDIDDARDAMSFYDGTDESVTQTLAVIDAHYADALDPETGDFLMQLVGVIDDPFMV